MGRFTEIEINIGRISRENLKQKINNEYFLHGYFIVTWNQNILNERKLIEKIK